MSCKMLLREVSNYLDADIEPAVRQQLEEHIEIGRASCRERVYVLV